MQLHRVALWVKATLLLMAYRHKQRINLLVGSKLPLLLLSWSLRLFPDYFQKFLCNVLLHLCRIAGTEAEQSFGQVPYNSSGFMFPDCR